MRESRRLLALERVVEQDITRAAGAHARRWSNSIGIGWYPIDSHPCVARPEVSLCEPTHPDRLPLGALIPRRTLNLLAACNNAGVTHVANGATRLQPVEWAIGEAAGTLAAFGLAYGATLPEVCASPALPRALDRTLLKGGAPIAWTLDIRPGHPAFVAEQERALADVG